MLDQTKSLSTAAPAVDILRTLYPPHAVIHVGAGQGIGSSRIWRESEPRIALLIDADASRLAWAEPLVRQHPGWRIIEAVVDQAGGEVDYHQATNPAEDGLIPVQALVSLWPNLRQRAAARRAARPLDQYMQALNLSEAIEPANAVWTIVDCLPAARILGGAEQVVEVSSVILARVLLQDVDGLPAEATQTALAALLEPLGYRHVLTDPSNHPAVGEAIFVRDWPRVLRERHAAQQTEANNQAQGKIETLTKTLEQGTQEKDQIQAKFETLTKTLEHRSQEKEQTEAKLEELTKSLEQRTQEKNQLQAKLDEQTKALQTAKAQADEQAKAAAQHKATAGEQTKAAAQHKATADEQAKLAAQHKAAAEKHSKLAAERAQQLEDSHQAQAALQRDSAIALRLQAQRDVDLKDLQQRHADVVAQKDKQAQLLKQLTERLTLASSYLSQLEHNGHRQGSTNQDPGNGSMQPQTNSALAVQDDQNAETPTRGQADASEPDQLKRRWWWNRASRS